MRITESMFFLLQIPNLCFFFCRFHFLEGGEIPRSVGTQSLAHPSYHTRTSREVGKFLLDFCGLAFFCDCSWQRCCANPRSRCEFDFFFLSVCCRSASAWIQPGY